MSETAYKINTGLLQGDSADKREEPPPTNPHHPFTKENLEALSNSVFISGEEKKKKSAFHPSIYFL